MGDPRRNKVLTNFIKVHYPKTKYQNILCVADGNFELTYLLDKEGYTVESWEPKPRREGYYD